MLVINSKNINLHFRLASEFGGVEFQNGLFVRKVSSGNVAIYLGYSDLGRFIQDFYGKIEDEKVAFGVVSVNHSEGDVIQT